MCLNTRDTYDIQGDTHLYNSRLNLRKGDESLRKHVVKMTSL